MGLDMYLNAKRYLFRGGDSLDEKISQSINSLFPDVPEEMEAKEICFEAMYWRKANSIHQWFVHNVQNGVDDCGNYSVSSDKLQDLLDIVNRVLKDKSLAPTLLPTKSGFFFGDMSYDDYYFQVLKKTQLGIKKLISLLKNQALTIEYHSSW